MKRAIIIGATSGIGYEVAQRLAKQGWKLGIVGRRLNRLQTFQNSFPEKQIEICQADVTDHSSIETINSLIAKLGGMDLFFLSSGIGFQNVILDPEIELNTVRTNGEGFMRMVTLAFNYFKQHATLKNRGHIAVISSIAGTKGLGVAPAYSATKRMQNCYIESLEQLARMQHLPIDFTDIRPGFVATDLLGDKPYPLLMNVASVADEIINALQRRKRVIIIDWRYRILVFFWRLIPRWIWVKLPVKN